MDTSKIKGIRTGLTVAPRRRLSIMGLAVAIAVGVAVGFAVPRGNSATASTGLPNTSDYHSLLVNPRNSQSLILGTHDGLYVSLDGGRHWRRGGLRNSDAMNLARPVAQTLWLAGHNVFKKSTDGGATWADVRPNGLPGLDLHGFAIAPGHPRVLYAAVAGEGLYRSRDGGRSFKLVSKTIGGNVMALAILPNGHILAGDMRRGLLRSSDEGRAWRQVFAAQILGLAVNPGNASRVLATGGGIAVSANGGHTWRIVLNMEKGAGPVAWSTSNPKLAYVVGFDRKLYLSRDRGESWRAVGGS